MIPARRDFGERHLALIRKPPPEPKCHGVWGRLPKEETMHRFFLAAVVAALTSPLPVVAQQPPSASQGKKEARGEGAKRPWTLLIYGAVDNSADDPFVAF